MPKYDFRCPDCHEEHEMTFSVHEDHYVMCDRCGADMKKVFSATPGHFKGQGWGKTYRVHKPKGEK